ncbi:MAG: HPr family phosphocarrier protein [Myxococcales bacterium]|nr:HPr family phosphocarrier protein [Polyangiaceae bacterium]MDW8250434.1 HPr family phosphocarrier protein [Myxococcales bacterium]
MSKSTSTFEIINERGLHARAAAVLTRLAQRYPCEITLSKDDQRANGKSIMGLLLLCGAKGTLLRVEAEGPQAEEAVQAIGALIAQRFGEEK